MSEMTEEIAEKARHLAAVALVASLGDARKTAAEALQRIDRECGGEGVEMAMRAWIDTTADRIGLPLGEPVQLVFNRTDRGDELTGADAVDRPEVVWAGRIAAARISGDIDGYEALLGALPHDPAIVGAHVMALLEGCALTMRRFGVTP